MDSTRAAPPPRSSGLCCRVCRTTSDPLRPFLRDPESRARNRGTRRPTCGDGRDSPGLRAARSAHFSGRAAWWGLRNPSPTPPAHFATTWEAGAAELRALESADLSICAGRPAGRPPEVTSERRSATPVRFRRPLRAPSSAHATAASRPAIPSAAARRNLLRPLGGARGTGADGPLGTAAGKLSGFALAGAAGSCSSLLTAASVPSC